MDPLAKPHPVDNPIVGVLGVGAANVASTLVAIHARDGRFGPNGMMVTFGSTNFFWEGFGPGLSVFCPPIALIPSGGEFRSFSAASSLVAECDQILLYPLGVQQLERITAVIERFKVDPPPYNLANITGYNCTGFARAVMAEAGLKPLRSRTSVGAFVEMHVKGRLGHDFVTSTRTRRDKLGVDQIMRDLVSGSVAHEEWAFSSVR